jgi:hypothetical protein
MPRRRLRAKDARRLAGGVSEADKLAYIHVRACVDNKIRALARRRPDPGTYMSYAVPPWIPGHNMYDSGHVCALLYAGLTRDGYRVHWDQSEPLILLIDWSEA